MIPALLSAALAAGPGVIFLDGGRSNPQTGAAFGTLAGGRIARLLLVPTALPEPALNAVNLGAMPQTARTHFGIGNVSILHAATRAEADSESFCAPMRTATAIYIMGGDHNRLLDAMPERGSKPSCGNSTSGRP